MFFTTFHTETYWLTVNGNNGFIGNLFEDTFFVNVILLNHQISYVILIVLISIFFLLSINFKFKFIISFFKFFTKSKKTSSGSVIENYDENVISEINYTNNETRVQENFAFENNISSSGNEH